MTELLDIARKGRASALTRIGGFPCGNVISAGAGARFRHLPRHEKAHLASARAGL